MIKERNSTMDEDEIIQKLNQKVYEEAGKHEEYLQKKANEYFYESKTN